MCFVFNYYHQLEKAKALYDRRYPLVRKEISFSGASKKTAKVVLFGETLAGSPVFRTIKGYRYKASFYGRPQFSRTVYLRTHIKPFK